MLTRLIPPSGGDFLPMGAYRALLKGVGRANIAECLLEAVNHATEFDHCTLFEFHGDRTPAVVGVASYGTKAKVLRSTRAYLDKFHRAEPVRDVMCAEGEHLYMRYHASAEIHNTEWRNVCYEAANIRDRLSFVGRIRPGSWFVANFFRESSRAPLLDDEIGAACALALPIALAGRQNAFLREEHRRATEPQFVQQMPSGASEVLSSREEEVCCRILAGCSIKEIAADLGLRESSIVTYRKRAYGKLGFSSKEELLRHCAADRILAA